MRRWRALLTRPHPWQVLCVRTVPYEGVLPADDCFTV